MPCDYLRHMANSSCLSNQDQILAHFKNYFKRHLLLTLDIPMSLLLNNNNSQSQSRLTTTEVNANDEANLDRKDHLASIVDGNERRNKIQLFWKFFFCRFCFET